MEPCFCGVARWMWALGWPLRYSHSPGEVIDTKGLDALSKIEMLVGGKVPRYLT
jgi:putative aminopeptidase FrvX